MVCFCKDVKVPVKVRRTLSSVGTSSSNNPGCVGDGVEPEVARHLLLSQVRLSHVNHGFPVGFNQTIRQLAFGRGSNNFRAVLDEIL